MGLSVREFWDELTPADFALIRRGQIRRINRERTTAFLGAVVAKSSKPVRLRDLLLPESGTRERMTPEQMLEVMKLIASGQNTLEANHGR